MEIFFKVVSSCKKVVPRKENIIFIFNCYLFISNFFKVIIIII